MFLFKFSFAFTDDWVTNIHKAVPHCLHQHARWNKHFFWYGKRFFSLSDWIWALSVVPNKSWWQNKYLLSGWCWHLIFAWWHKHILQYMGGSFSTSCLTGCQLSARCWFSRDGKTKTNCRAHTDVCDIPLFGIIMGARCIRPLIPYGTYQHFT